MLLAHHLASIHQIQKGPAAGANPDAFEAHHADIQQQLRKLLVSNLAICQASTSPGLKGNGYTTEPEDMRPLCSAPKLGWICIAAVQVKLLSKASKAKSSKRLARMLHNQPKVSSTCTL